MIQNKILYRTPLTLDYHGGESILIHANQNAIDSNNLAQSVSIVSAAALTSSDFRFGSGAIDIQNTGYLDIKLPYNFQLSNKFQYEAWYKTPGWDKFNPFSFNNEPNKTAHLYDNAYYLNSPVRAYGNLSYVHFYNAYEIPYGVWFHYAISYDGKYHRVFINGVMKHKWEITDTSYVTNIIVGARLYGAQYWSITLVDEIKIRLNSAIYIADSGFDVLQSEFLS